MKTQLLLLYRVHESTIENLPWIAESVAYFREMVPVRRAYIHPGVITGSLQDPRARISPIEQSKFMFIIYNWKKIIVDIS